MSFDNYTIEADESGVKQHKTKFDDLQTADVETPMYIMPRGMAIDKESLAQTPKMVLTGIIKHLDEYRKDAIVTVEMAGINGDLTAIIRNFAGYNTGDKIKLAVNPHAVVVGEYESVAAVITSEAAQNEGEVRRKEIEAARAKEKELEAAAKQPAKPKKEQAATTTEPAEKAVAAKKPAAKAKPAARTTAVKRPTAKKK